jgi:hypothetical protein
VLVFLMLNPSTADANHDDPTIRRCIGFAKDRGFGGIDVVNLFAWRATRPSELLAVDDPVGPMNDMHIRAASEGRTIVAAWGAGGSHRDRVAHVWQLIPFEHVVCLGITKHGHPRHPLYVRADAELTRWRLALLDS